MSTVIPTVEVEGVPLVQPAAASAPGSAPASAPLLDPDRVEFEVDSKGRRIGARRLTALEEFDLTLLLGDAASNGPALNQVLAFSSVVEIDGKPVAFPANYGEIRFRLQQIGNHGLRAALKALARINESERAAVPKDAIKN